MCYSSTELLSVGKEKKYSLDHFEFQRIKNKGEIKYDE